MSQSRYRHTPHRRGRSFRDYYSNVSSNNLTFEQVAKLINIKDICYYLCIIIIAINVFISINYLSTNNTANNTSESPPSIPKTTKKVGLTHKPVNGYLGNDCLYTYMQLTDGTFEYLYGILAIHGALIRTNSKFAHNVMLMPNVTRKQINLLHHLGIGTYNIDGSVIDPYLTKCGNCWTVTFYKLFIFNMTSFDKILYLDTDVGIMHYDGIDELFSHPTPSAVSDRGGNHFELNGGVLLVSPDSNMFQSLLNGLVNVRNAKQLYDEAKDAGVNPPNIDNWNSEYRDNCGDQGYLNAFFNSNSTDYGPFYSLHYRYGLLTSSFSNEWQRYLLTHRPYILKNVHFTVYKPWHRDGLNRFRQMTDNIGKQVKYKDDVNLGNGGYAGYQDEVMARFFVRYWLDIKIALKKCGIYCKRNFPDFEVPGDVERFLKIRPEPFTCHEDRIEYISNDEFQRKNKGKCLKY